MDLSQVRLKTRVGCAIEIRRFNIRLVASRSKIEEPAAKYRAPVPAYSGGAHAYDQSGILVLAPTSSGTKRRWSTRLRKISMPLYRLPGEESQLLDFECVEFVEKLMNGQ